MRTASLLLTLSFGLGAVACGDCPATSANGDYSNGSYAGCDVSGQSLTNPDFSGADLTDADFTNATLSNPNFDGATLTNAVFTGATITNPSCEMTTGASFSTALVTNGDDC